MDKTYQEKQAAGKLSVKTKLFNSNKDTARIYFTLTTRAADYYKLPDQEKFRAAYRITYQIYLYDAGNRKRVDSSSLKLVDLNKTTEGKNLVAYIETVTGPSKEFQLQFQLENLDNHARYENSIRFNTITCSDPENILLINKSGIPAFEKNYQQTTGKIQVCKNCQEEVILYKITGGTKYPKPPFDGDENFASSNNYSPVKSPLNRVNNSLYTFDTLSKGFYTIQFANKAGVIFYHFNQWYPECNDTAGFYEPLIYITTRSEFSEFESGTEGRSKFEKFWTVLAGNKTDARKAINTYYKRVFEANREFTAVTEGWRTDRGMIHIIFGKPDHIEKQFKKEIWYYRSNYNVTISFSFNKIDNPYTDNDYHLERDVRYKPEWYNAVQNWRSGKAFNLNRY